MRINNGNILRLGDEERVFLSIEKAMLKVCNAGIESLHVTMGKTEPRATFRGIYCALASLNGITESMTARRLGYTAHSSVWHRKDDHIGRYESDRDYAATYDAVKMEMDASQSFQTAEERNVIS